MDEMGSHAAMRVIRCAGRTDLEPDDAATVATAVGTGGVIVYPTDTLYGLGADPASPTAIDAVFRLKGRAPDKPLPVLIADATLLGRYAAEVPAQLGVLVERLWPGPLTLLFPARPGLPSAIRSAAGKVALRVPGSALCRAILRAAGGSLTGTSANPSGTGGTGDPREVRRSLSGAIALFLDAGELPPSPPSTLLEIDEAGVVRQVRAGAATEAAWRQALAARR